MSRSLTVSLIITTALACVGPVSDDAPAELAFPLVDAGSAEELGMLAFVNAEETTFALLDDEVRLDRRAASGIVAQRDGADGVFGTADDAPFQSVEELDAVPYVGAVALEKLLAWARDEGFIDAGQGLRESAILGLVNDGATTFNLLDVDVGLDRRAAENIMAHRAGDDGALGTSDDVVFRSLGELDAIAYVGPAALDALAAYGIANGYGANGPSAPPCLVFSEYLEGSGRNNKAFEIYNCSEAAVALDAVRVCLVRNDAVDCSNHASVGGGQLEAGHVRTLCRTTGGTFNDPFEPLRAACDVEVGGVATFDGDDRLVLFVDENADESFGTSDTVLDVFGELAVRPSDTPWAEVNLRRCDLAAHLGGAFDLEEKFDAFGRTDMSHLGVAPDPSCGVRTPAAEGEDCEMTADCASGLRCFGQPHDGSSPFGKCVDPTPVPGEGASCDRFSPCAEGLICAGFTLWGEGTCNPQWMAGRFEFRSSVPIADGGTPTAPSLVVYGLASVPVDLDVTVHIEHPRPTDLRVTLTDPNGDSAVLWDRTTELQRFSRSFVTNGISRDDAVNGRWHLHFEDLVAGQSGTIERWSLFVTSRWD